MKKLFGQINDVLIEWDPIGVGNEIAATEYIMYIPEIIKHSNNEAELLLYLQHLITKTMGLGYDNNNTEHRAELLLVCQKILHVIHKCRMKDICH